MARRKLIWTRMAPAITSLNPVGVASGNMVESQDLLQTFRNEAGITRGPVGLTVMRIRMLITADLSTNNSLANIRASAGLYYGIRVCDFSQLAAEEAVEAPNFGPQLDPHADWMTWGRVPMKALTQVDASNQTGLFWEEVDVRAMRKMEELGQTLGLYIQTTTGAAAVVSNVLASTSVLVALP